MGDEADVVAPSTDGAVDGATIGPSTDGAVVAPSIDGPSYCNVHFKC